MRDVAEAVSGWLAGGLPVALARVMSMEGFGGRRAGESWACTPGLAPVGEVAMGAADADVRTAADRLLADDSIGALSISVPVGDDEAVRAGLACGGVAAVLVQRASLIPASVWQAVADRVPVVVATSVRDGAVLAVSAGGDVVGSVGSAVLDASVTEAAVTMLTRGRVQAQVVDDAVFVELTGPRPHLVVLGEAELAQALVAQGALLGWDVTVASEAQTAEVVAAVEAMGPLDAAVVLSHDIAASCSVLAAALRGRCGYAGALGSRHTQAARAEHLRSVLALSSELVAEVHGPVGLDLGSRTPAETALAIYAEILASRSGRAAAPLRAGGGPING